MDEASNATASTKKEEDEEMGMKKEAAFKRYTKQILAKGDAEEADAWLLTYPLFSSSSSPTRQLFSLWEKRYTHPSPLSLPPIPSSFLSRPRPPRGC
jgi:hypothetical protein